VENAKTLVQSDNKSSIDKFICNKYENKPPKSIHNKKYLGLIIEKVEATQEDKGVIINHHYYSISDCPDNQEIVSDDNEPFFSDNREELNNEWKLLGGKTRRKYKRRTQSR